jgi:hypothetical protein
VRSVKEHRNACGKISDCLTHKLGDEVYTALVEMTEDRIDTRLAIMSERFERRLTEVTADLRADIHALRTDMAGQHAEVLKWALVFWVSQAATMAGIAIGIVSALR